MNEEKSTPTGATSKETSGTARQPRSAGLQQTAKETADAAQQELEKLKSTTQGQGIAAVEEVKAASQNAAREIQQAGRDFFEEQKTNLAQRMDEYAKAMDSASKRLRSEEDRLLADPAQKLAEKLREISNYLREKDPADFFEDLETFARRRPEIVLGAFFVVGLGAARFFKASHKRPQVQTAEPAGSARPDPQIAAHQSMPAQPSGGSALPSAPTTAAM
jgi:hypothetical protein